MRVHTGTDGLYEAVISKLYFEESPQRLISKGLGQPANDTLEHSGAAGPLETNLPAHGSVLGLVQMSEGWHEPWP